MAALRWLTRFSLRNPLVIIILSILVLIGGVISALGLHEELMPDVDFPVIAVVVPYPGASPDQVASQVSEPLERALQGVADVKNVTSVSTANVAEIEIEFNLNADLNAAQQKVQDIVNQAHLPSGTLKPTVQKFSFNSAPVVYLTVASSNGDLQKLRTTVQNTIVPALEGVPGVASVQLGGAAPDQVQIRFDPAKLRDHHLTFAQAVQELQAANVTQPLGSASVGGTVQPIELAGAPKTLDDLKNLRLPVPADASAGMKQAMAGMSQLGHTVGQLAQGMGALSQGMGQLAQGVGQLGQGVATVAAENQLLNEMLQVQGQLFGAELALAQQQALPEAARNPQTVAQLQAQVQALTQAQQKLQQQLTALQKQLAASAGKGGETSMSPPAAGAAQLPVAQRAQAGSAASTQTSETLQTVKLSDIADVTLAPPADHSINRTNGQPSVFVGVVKTEDANTVDMARAVNAKLADLSKQLPAGIHIVPLFDSSQMITASVNGMLREALLGALFAAVVILLFLRSVRNTIIAVVSIPLSLLISTILLRQLGITLNIMTLGGMAVATGRVVDDSIVVIENIHRRFKQGELAGKALVLDAAAEVGQAITASTITTVAVFLPLGLVSGLVGKIFYPFALTVVCALLSSLLVALTVVPALAWLLLVRAKTREAVDAAAAELAVTEQPGGGGGTSQWRPWQLRYQRMLAACLNHKGWLMAAAGLLLVASIAVLPLAGSTFIPESREKFATVSITMPVGTPLSATDAKTRQVEAIIRTYVDTVAQMNAKVGSDPGQLSDSGSVSGENQASLFLELQPDTDVSAFTASLRQKLQGIAGPAQIQVKEMILGGSGEGFDIVLTGGTSAELQEAAQRVTKALQDLPGLANVSNNLTQTQPEVQVVPDSAKAAQYGLTSYQIATAAAAAISGQNMGSITLNGDSYDVEASLADTSVGSLDAIRNLEIDTPVGKTVHLGDVARVNTVQTPVTITHQNGQPFAEIKGDFTTNNTGQVSRTAMDKIRQLHLPADIQVQLSGATQEQNQSFQQLIEAIIIAAGLVYLVMLMAFGDWKAPFSILFSMPVALIGAFFGTVIGHQPVSVSSLIGILMLMGIVVTNAIVLVDRVERQRARGRTVRDALLEAATTRLRPILMTAIATVCALFPLALGFSEGALISQGLAVVVIGGLVTSTLLTLVVVPVVYELLHREPKAA
ncbi:MAG: efflux RND transporter permease subunit [Thermoflavifilum sp.]|nr:efflux RND transporter permease subunit [Thermoflavifilum sp.]MCL6514197.1 efflux RND transporter permease subunit [Alicyclobacillus sp.]